MALDRLDIVAAFDVIGNRLAADEDADLVSSGTRYLAMRRAEMAGRAPEQADLEYILAIFCWWPLKTPPPEATQRRLRSLRLHAFGESQDLYERLDALVPPVTLVGTREALSHWQQQPVESFLNVQARAPHGGMTKARFVAAVAERAGMGRGEAARAVDAVLDTITDTLRRGDSVTFTGFGKFSTAARAARMGVNPRTGETVEIAATTVPKFSAGSALKSSVKSG